MKIEYVVGDATEPKIEGLNFIVHCCNDINSFASGFVVAITNKWPGAKKCYHNWCMGMYDDIPFGPGELMIYPCPDDKTFIVNIIGQRGVCHSLKSDIAPIRYEWVQKGLMHLATEILNNIQMLDEDFKPYAITVHMPRIGCGLAGGNWNKMEPIINETLIVNNIRTIVYDLPEPVMSEKR